MKSRRKIPQRVITTATALTLLSLPHVSSAAEPESGGGGSVSLGSDGADADADGSASGKKEKDRGDVKWIKRWAPERNMGEIGIFGGVLFPARRLELFEPDLTLPDQGFKQFQTVAPDVGARIGYYPSRFFGLEVEGAVMPTSTLQDQSAILYSARGHLVAQIGLWSITPFVLAGANGFGVASDRAAAGNDIDLGFHFGGGLKFYLARYVALRLDVRDNLSARRGVGEGVIHNAEILGGLSITLGRKKTKKPEGPKDTDGDGIMDPDDKCVEVPGVPEYDGCPIPDTDGDGILDPDDKCVDTPGVPEYDGCPIPDTDGDGILDPDDKCVEEPETKNGYQDGDGCPDEVPKELKKFTGVIEGIYFDTAKASIRKKSERKLQQAADTLVKFPDTRIEVSGHTDSKGNDDYNQQLSNDRAESVKQWLVDHGVDASRIDTRGAGENEPIASNKTRKGRAENRRIEFKLLQ